MQAEEMPARVQEVVSGGKDWQAVCGGLADVEARVDQRGAVYWVRVAVSGGACAGLRRACAGLRRACAGLRRALLRLPTCSLAHLLTRSFSTSDAVFA